MKFVNTVSSVREAWKASSMNPHIIIPYIVSVALTPAKGQYFVVFGKPGLDAGVLIDLPNGGKGTIVEAY